MNIKSQLFTLLCQLCQVCQSKKSWKMATSTKSTNEMLLSLLLLILSIAPTAPIALCVLFKVSSVTACHCSVFEEFALFRTCLANFAGNRNQSVTKNFLHGAYINACLCLKATQSLAELPQLPTGKMRTLCLYSSKSKYSWKGRQGSQATSPFRVTKTVVSKCS